MSMEFTSRVKAIPVYPAASTYAFDGELVKLASNETPWGPHAAVLEAVETQLRTLNRYPDPTAAKLRGRLADRYELPAGGGARGHRPRREPPPRGPGAPPARGGGGLPPPRL